MPSVSMANRPRLKAMASSTGSRAAIARATNAGGPASTSPLAGRSMFDVTIEIGTAAGAGGGGGGRSGAVAAAGAGMAGAPGRSSVTVAAVRSQLRISSLPKRATERVPSIAQRQVPGVIGASRQSVRGLGLSTGAGGGAGRAVAVAVGEGTGLGMTRRSEQDAASKARPAASKGVTTVRFAIIASLWNQEFVPATLRRHLRLVNNPPRPRPAAKQRVDQLLVDRGLAESRTRAQALVLAGLVFSGEAKLAKPGQTLAGDAPLEVRGRDHPWVSRGGIKLAHALEHFGLNPGGAVAMDIGSSTGGFTDVLLHHGAARVFAVDSGTNQLAWRLRQDPRVTVLEQTSARVLTPDLIDAPCDWVVCDASFIGLAKVLEVPLRLAAHRCQLVALIKPQFEVGKGEVGKGGVVRDPALHARVCSEVRAWLEGEGWLVQGIVESPITGPEGNVEFLIAARRG